MSKIAANTTDALAFLIDIEPVQSIEPTIRWSIQSTRGTRLRRAEDSRPCDLGKDDLEAVFHEDFEWVYGCWTRTLSPEELSTVVDVAERSFQELRAIYSRLMAEDEKRLTSHPA